MFTKLSLRYKIISLVIAAIVIPALVLNVVITSISRYTLRTSLFYRQQETARRVADRIDAQIKNHLQLLDLNRDIFTFPVSERLRRGREIIKHGSAFSEVSLVDTTGKEIWKLQRSGASKNLVSRAGRPEITTPLSGRTYIGKVTFTGRRSPFILIAVPTRREGNMMGALVARLDLDQVWQWISEVQIGETGHAFVVDGKGVLIAHPEPERVWVHSNFENLSVVSDFIKNKGNLPREWQEYTDERGRRVVAVYQPLRYTNWAVVTQTPSEEVYAPIRDMQKSIFIGTSLFMLLMLIVGYRFVRRITDPIARLKEGADRISKGKLDISLDIHTGDEIEELARDFEEMALSLRQLEDLRQDLTRMIIHDLKSPLSGIMGSLDFLESGMMGDFNEDQRKIISMAKKSSENMLSMVQNLLDIAKMEEGKLELKKERIDLAQLLKEREVQFAPLMHTENKTIESVISPGVPPVYIERGLIERVLNNLISNAVHHTTSGGRIKLTLDQWGDQVQLSVIDNGQGIPKEYQGKIFEKFVQIERRQARLRTGAGLGLTFCKMVVEAHGGHIRVESDEGKGSAFIFTVPVN